ncbi:MAG: hypothetical protein J6B27_02255 [Alistipes sp.]|nr:hypothetical protein [Alistipes sp.]
MRSVIALLVVMAMAVPFASCDKESSTPVIKLGQNPMDIPSTAGDYYIEYTIANPVVGGRLDAETECEWIKDVDATYEKIKFEVEANYEATRRSGEIELFYDGAAKVILTINQAGAVNELNGHKFVDLGLSVKWATCNIGAEDQGDAGNYYMWADLVDRKSENYSADNYPYITKTMVQDKDKDGNPVFDEETGEPVMSEVWNYTDIGSNISGNTQYDVARKEWGSTWRIPTQEEVQELIANCTFVWTNYKTATGFEITSKINGMKIFMPAVGYYMGTGQCSYFGSNGSYWTASAFSDDGDPGAAYYILMTSGRGFRLDYTSYHSAHPIRPVTE